MNIFAHINLKSIFSKLALLLVFIFLGFGLVACDDDYKNISITLSNGGEAIILYFEDNVSTTETIVAKVNAKDSISKEIRVSCNNTLIDFATEVNDDKSTSITITANGVCTNALVTITSLEGNKTASFFVSVEIPIVNLNSTTDKKELYVVRGEPKKLALSKLVDYTPAMTTQKDVTYELAEGTASGASLVNNELVISKDYKEPTITLKVTSSEKPTAFTDVVLDVIEPFTTENLIYSALFTGTSKTIEDLNSTIVLAKNITTKNSVDFSIKVKTDKEINIMPYIKSTVTQMSSVIKVASSQKTVIADGYEFLFTINTETINGDDAFYFVVTYADYGYSHKTKEFSVTTYDAIKTLQFLVDGKVPSGATFPVYDTYYGSYGLEIQTLAMPTTIPEGEKYLILTLQNNSSNYNFYNNIGQELVFEDNKYEFMSGEKIYVTAKSDNAMPGQIKIESKVDSSLFQIFTVKAQTGATTMTINNAKKDSKNNNIFYLTSNEIYTQKVEFYISNNEVNKVQIQTSGSAFTVDTNMHLTATNNTYYFTISSVKNAIDGNGLLVIKAANGLFVEAKIDVFKAISEDDVSFTVPSSQENSAVGLMQNISHLSTAVSPNLQFSVAIKKGSSIQLKKAENIINVKYDFYEYVLGTDSPYTAGYENFQQIGIVKGTNNLGYKETSIVVRTKQLSNNSAIYGEEVGKSWVRATVTGISLNNDGEKTEPTFYFYFFIEVYVPINTFYLSQSTLNLYAENSIGYADASASEGNVSIGMTEGATYSNIEWTGSDVLDLSYNGKRVYTFSDNVNSVKVKAYSTLKAFESAGLTEYRNVNRLEYYFVAKVQEFNIKSYLTLKVNIIRAQQVEKIIVLDVNVDNGIYIPLTFDGNDITRQITAEVQMGDSNIEPYNSDLVYEFLPDGDSYKNILTIDSETGLLKVSGNTMNGGTGVIRIAPADRYTASGYNVAEGETDVAIYIPITIADGQSQDTAYRITNVDQITNTKNHYVLMNSVSINSENSYAILESFEGGLYGSIKGQTNYATIFTNKPLFDEISDKAKVADLLIQGNIVGAGSVANLNNGTIQNVTLDTMTTNSQYVSSTITSDSVTYVGGIVAINNGTIKDCKFYGTIVATNAIVGGIVGQNTGDITNSVVELYNFVNPLDLDNNTYASISGGVVVGGLVGEMTNGTLKNCYIYSYAYQRTTPANYIGLNLLSGATKGAIIGNLLDGNVDICFAFVNDVPSIIGNVYEGNLVKNAFVLYYDVDNSTILSSYTKEFVQNVDVNSIHSNDIWQVESGVNYNLPYFKNFVQSTPITEIANTLTTKEDNIISIENKTIIYYYATESALTLQESMNISSMNFITFKTLLDSADTTGIRAFTSNSSILSVYGNGIRVSGTGFVTLTILSKYDYTLSQTFEIYVIYPIIDFTLMQNGMSFGNLSELNVKIINDFALKGNVQNSIILDKNNVSIYENDVSLVFFDYLDYITGAKLEYVFNTNAIYSDLNITRVNIPYALTLEGDIFTSENLLSINEIMASKFSGNFFLNLYKGADEIYINGAVSEVESTDNIIIEGYIYSDLPITETATLEDILITIQTTGYEDMFDIKKEIVSSIYYTSKTDLTQTTTNIEDAIYYKHTFKITLNVKDIYKNYSFDSLTGQGTEIKCLVYAKSSMVNNMSYNSALVSQDYKIILHSQNINSVNISHHILNSKNLVYDASTQTNTVYYTYNLSATSVMAPGDEGLMKINIYPDYANYDYLDVTYRTQTGATQDLRLGIMSLQSNGSYVRSNSGYETLLENNQVNGLRVYNSYINANANKGNVQMHYLNTYISNNLEKDTIFIITINAVRNGKVIKSTEFNIIVQYLDGAEITLLNKNGTEVDTIARGSSNTIILTMQKEQRLEKLIISGVDGSNNSAQNYITYSSFVEEEITNSTLKTYTASLFVGEALTLLNNANYITFQATITWVFNGKEQIKTTTQTIAVVDFIIDKISLLTDKVVDTNAKQNFNAYKSIQSKLQFDFNGNMNQDGNSAFNSFLKNHYYENLSGVNNIGDYIVNRGNVNAISFIQNLYYDGNVRTAVYNPDGTLNPNQYFSFNIDKDGNIIVEGRITGVVSMVFVLPVQYPDATKMHTGTVELAFNITISEYSDEDVPLLIDSEEAFYDALSGNIVQNYILMTDLNLTNYTPQNTTSIASLDGNNHTINILSWNLSEPDAILNLALFDIVDADTTLKNLTINTYHASKIAINTSITTTINIAGLAITNNGIIYNCEVVAYQTDFTKPSQMQSGILVSYSSEHINTSISSKISGFVITNNGYITNSRVGGISLTKVTSDNINLGKFEISGQGDIAGFVFENRGSIASSYFANGTITNNTASGIETKTSGFVHSNIGKIFTSYSNGVGLNSYSLVGGGITTSSISTGFAYSNSGQIGDCYANILLATTSSSTRSLYESGRLTSGFIYSNVGTISRCYTASKIEDAKNTQTAFLGVDESGNMQNSGTIENSYYYAISALEGDAYSSSNENISIKRITEPDNQEYFYGFAFSDDASSVNGVWYSTSYGVQLVSANQVAISHRYLAGVVRDKITNELTSYKLPYTSGYEYGSVKNPIIIRSASEYNLVFGGAGKVGTAISSYYNLSDKTVFGNYRLITDITFNQDSTGTTGNVKVSSTNKILKGGIIDGNMFTISGITLTADSEESIPSFGLFAELQDNAIIMNLEMKIVSVYAGKAQCLGAVAGSVYDSKVINIKISSTSDTLPSDVTGNNIVGGLVGKVQGDSEIKNLTATNINVKATAFATGNSQLFSRNIQNTSINSSISYAGGVIGVADIYKPAYATSYAYDNEMTIPSISFLKATGIMSIRGSTVGGVVGYIGPRTYLKDATLELSGEYGQKLSAYTFFAGGIVGENYGDLEMVRTQHESYTQKEIEDNISAYYINPSDENINRGNVELFEESETYTPMAIGGLVGQMGSGKIEHAYSKINVASKYAKYAGGVIGQVPYSALATKNIIDVYEVYAFGDVKASQTIAKSGAGGIVGYIDYTRKLTFNKVNAVNFWSLLYNETTSTYYLPTNSFMIYALTGTNSATTYVSPEYITTIANNHENTITINSGYTEYSLPTISCSVNSDDIYAINKVKFNNNNTTTPIETNVQESYAALGGGNLYNMVYPDKQAIVALFDLDLPAYNGITMDKYFLQSDWDPNYWVRYSRELLPKLVIYNDSNNFYIDKAEDLQKIIRYPNGTFIVRGLESPTTIIKVGSYIKSSGIDFSSIVFTGVIKGLDNSLNYGFDFEDFALPFLNSVSGAKLYNMTIQNMGSSTSAYSEMSTSFTNTATLTSFENLLFKDCLIFASSNIDLDSVGIMANEMSGGYVSNITFVDCAVNVLAYANLSNLNVGLMTGKVKTQGNSFMQLADITAYMSNGNQNTSYYNDINVNLYNKQINTLNIGAIAGATDGSVLLNYTASSTTSSIVKGLGVANSLTKTFVPDNQFSGLNNGLVIDVVGEGNVGVYNAGLMFGQVNNLNIGFQRTNESAKLNIVGGFLTSGNGVIGTANVGGIVGKSNVNTSISNGATNCTKYVIVDADIAFTANKINAGMLIGSSANINSIDNIDTYGTINIRAINGGTSLGGFIGVSNGNLGISNASSRTAITYNDETNSNFSNIGGLVGLFNSNSANLKIGEGDYNTKYFGTIIINGKNINVGGLVGGIIGSTSSLSGDDNVQIISSVFGGNIIVNNAEQIYVGGLLGNTNTTNGSNELRKTLTSNLCHGDININCDLSEKENPSYVGGLLGKGSNATHINGNYSITTINTKTTDITEKMNINALVGALNGSITDGNAINYYSNQVSLCLDYNQSDLPGGFLCENIYYQTNNGLDTTQKVMVDVLVDVKRYYEETLTEAERMNEILYYGSKLNPIKIENDTYMAEKINFASGFNGLRKFIVMTGQLTKNIMTNISLTNAHLIGDGFTITTTSNAIFESISADSVVAGIKVNAEITTQNTSVYSSGSVFAIGAGTLANVNNGTIYACNVTEQQSAKEFEIYGVKNSLSNVYTGGLVGVNGGVIIDSCCDVDVKTTSTAGGLVGLNNGIINNCFSTGIVDSTNAFAFGQGGLDGSVYNSYTASTAKNGIAQGAGVFGNNKVVDCFYDLYATSVFDAVSDATMSDTNSMSIMAVQVDEKPIFLTNPTATEKFGYDMTKNYGYLSFIGDAYSNFTYLQNANTGDGLTEDTAFMIHNVGRLQQINLATRINYYLLIQDLAISSDIKTHGAEDYGVAKWKAIGDSAVTSFMGHFSGLYNSTNYHKLTGISQVIFNESAYGAVFGATSSATIKNLNIVTGDVSISATKVAGLVSEATNTTISNINVDISSLHYNASSSASIGGIISDAKGTTTLSNCSVVITGALGYGSTSGTSSGTSSIGGLVGQASESASISSCHITSGVTINYSATGGLSAGGFVGIANGSTSTSSTVVAVSSNTIDANVVVNYTSTQSSSSTSNLGGVVGNVLGANILDNTISGTTSFAYSAGGECYIGALVGESNGGSVSDMDISNTTINYSTTSSGNKAGLGGLVGKSVNTTYSDVSLGDECELTYTSSTSSQDSYIGGLVGLSNSSTFDTITIGASYDLTYNSTGEIYMGGIVGMAENESEFNDVTAGLEYKFTTTPSNTTTKMNYMGGIAGSLSSTDLTTVNTGASYKFTYNGKGTSYMGGIAGDLVSSDITSCEVKESYEFTSTTDCTNYMGGIAGKFTGATFSSSKILEGYKFTYSGTKDNYMGGMFGEGTGIIDASTIPIGTGYTYNYGATAGVGVTYGANYMGGIIAKADNITMQNATTVTVDSPVFNYGANGDNFIGGVAGLISSSTMSNFKVTNFDYTAVSYGSETAKIPCVGGMASKISNSNISNVTIENSTLKLGACGYAGGIAGLVEGSSDMTFQTLSISGLVITDDAKNKNTAIGGLIGRTVAPGLTISGGSVTTGSETTIVEPPPPMLGEPVAPPPPPIVTEISSTLSGNYCVGGLVGMGTFKEIKNCNSNSTVIVYHADVYDDNGSRIFQNTELLTSGKSMIYAGGIVGILTSGNITDCTNTGAVKAGTGEENGTRTYTQVSNNVYEPYAGGIAGLISSSTLKNVTNSGTVNAGFRTTTDAEKLKKNNFDTFLPIINETGLNTADDVYCEYGSSASYAGGIAGLTENSTYDTVSNNGEIVAKAKLSLSFKYSVENDWFEWYKATCYYGVQEEKAYANGITYTNNLTIDFQTCTNTGDLVGGKKSEFNMFTSNEIFGGEYGSFDSAYILDYGFTAPDSTGRAYNSFSIYNDWLADFVGGMKAWKSAHDKGVKMVMVDVANIHTNIPNSTTVKWGDTGYSSDNPDDFNADGSGKTVYVYQEGRKPEKILHYKKTTMGYDEEEVYVLVDSDDNEYQITDINVNSKIRYQDTSNIEVAPVSEANITELANNFYTNDISNIITKTSIPASQRKISLLNELSISMTSEFTVIRNTSPKGADPDIHLTLGNL